MQRFQYHSEPHLENKL